MIAAEELKKIGIYFAEGEKLWSRSPEQVTGRAFFELWETFQKPVPFAVGPGTFNLEETLSVTLPDGWDGAEVSIHWSDRNACVILRLNHRNWTKQCLLRFRDGKIRMEEQPPVEHHEERISPDHLDAARFLAGKIRERGTKINPDKLKKKDFLDHLRTLPPEYPKSIRAEMRELPLAALRELFRIALADLPEDELGPQMVLPLDGSYAPDVTGKTVILNPKTSIPKRTPWKSLRPLELLAECDRLLIENERDFVLSFDRAEILDRNPETGILVLGLQTEESVPLYQDDLLKVFEAVGSVPYGTFQVDFFDGTQIMGRLTPGSDKDFAEVAPHLCGVLLRSPFELYAKMLRTFQETLLAPTEKQTVSAADALLGREDLLFASPPQEKPTPKGMNESQKTAFLAAAHPENRVVQIQGPPGTGKTYVLEQLLRQFHEEGRRVLIAAPSHTAVDNICRRIPDLPFLRCGRNADSIDPDIRRDHWLGDPRNYHRIREDSSRKKKAIFFAGTHTALLKEALIDKYRTNYGLFDAIVFDEAGMSGSDVILLCSRLAERCILFGDHLQLPPFPLPGTVLKKLSEEGKNLDFESKTLLTRSAMEWLTVCRKFPVHVLNTSYRCENPRLLRFASTVFYTGEVRPAPGSDYYRLPPLEREEKYPPSTLRWVTTSGLPEKIRHEQVTFDAGKPGIVNPVELHLAQMELDRLCRKYRLREITLIAPYRRQITALKQHLREHLSERFPPEEIQFFLATCVNTVDSFQGGENEAVIITYVRSNSGRGLGFTDSPNRINVAYTRCRRELVIVGDLECLKEQEKNGIFRRMERAFRRDGEIIPAENMLSDEKMI